MALSPFMLGTNGFALGPCHSEEHGKSAASLVFLSSEGVSDLLLEELAQGGHALLQHLLVLQAPDGRHRLPRDHRHQHAVLLLGT